MHTTTPNSFSVFIVESAKRGKIRLKAETGEYLHPMYDRQTRKNLLGVSSKLDDSGMFGVEVIARFVP
ncbi:hypothetical protein BWQ96_05020 [Gracilariopsis chorda]|uniref:Uncharacterized protein n=1 Tax=Gracilariopsis chorda TaxID=448386 RepID=A0A2V3IT13_9FLOR|nr:hypothetical protein BWQ96_05020 [Gracilariopsis chorda]|eukprot:PXF45254.1 hypothetical protein BWQ96_05020 [Gracilariopsis chorda]